MNLHRAEEMIRNVLDRSDEPSRVVRIMAVTKTHPPCVIRMSIDAGISLIGENRVTEGGRKVKEIGKGSAEYHMIGPIHTGEVRQALRDFHWIDSIDRMKIADEIARRTVMKNLPQPGLLVEVNTSGEEAKHGFAPDYSLLEEKLGLMKDRGLRISGLLTVGPLGGSESQVRKAFSTLRSLCERLRNRGGFKLNELSMGMSDDFHLAVAEGSTLIRLGRFLFGRREN